MWVGSVMSRNVISFLGFGLGSFLASQCHHTFGEYWGSCTLIGASEGPLLGVSCHHSAAQQSLLSVKSGYFCFSAPAELST